MFRAYLFIIFIFLSSNILAQGSTLGAKLEAVDANDKEQCLQVIKEIFKELPESQILQFVKVQTSLTTHRMAWAHLSHLQSQGKEKLTRDKNGVTQEKFEASIKALLERDIEELTRLKKAKELERASKLFNEYAQGLGPDSYRTTLAKLSPSLRGAINRQLDEKGTPSIYKVNAGDIAILNVLAQGEDLRAGKKGYRHIQTYKDTRGNLNIARMINSSLNGKIYHTGIKDDQGNYYHYTDKRPAPSTDSTSNNIASNIEVFKKVIENQEKELNDLINGMLPSNQAACLNQKNFCDTSENLDSNLASFLLGSEEIAGFLQEEIQSRSADQAFKSKLLKALHYCENWLHTDTKCIDPHFRDQFCDNCSMEECREPKKPVIPDVDPDDPDNPPVIPDDDPDTPDNPPVIPDEDGEDEDNKDPKTPSIIINNDININIINIGAQTGPTIPTGGLPSIIVVSNPQSLPAILAMLGIQNPSIYQPGTGTLPNFPGVFPGYNPGGFNPGGNNPGGTNPGGNNPGGNNPGGNTENKPKASWGINLSSKVDKIIGADGENISTIVTVGKVDKSKKYCVNWKFPANLKEKNKETIIPDNFIKAAQKASITIPFPAIFAPYQKQAYKVKAHVHICGDQKKLATSVVEVKRAWEGGTFSCKYNPANWNLDVCNPIPRNLVPFRPFNLSGTDGNQGF